MANLPLLPDKARRASVVITNASGTTTQTLLTCAASGGFIESLWVASTHDAVDGIVVTFWVSDGITDALIDSVLIPPASAASPAVVVNVLDSARLTYLDPNGVQFRLGGGDMIKVRAESVVPLTKEIAVTAQYGEYPVG